MAMTGCERAASYRERCRIAEVCVFCRVPLGHDEYGRCERCRKRRLDEAAQSRFDRRVDREEQLKQRGLICVDDAAVILGLHRNSILKLIWKGIITVEQISYRAYWIKRRAIVQLRSRRQDRSKSKVF